MRLYNGILIYIYKGLSNFQLLTQSDLKTISLQNVQAPRGCEYYKRWWTEVTMYSDGWYTAIKT